MSTYTGDVTVGGPAESRAVDGILITKLAVGDFDNNCYFVECLQTGELLLIDAAADPDRLLRELGGRPLKAVLTTHCHPDHWQALESIVSATGATTYAHPADAGVLPVTPDVLVNDGDHVLVGAADLEAIHLVGHTDGSIAMLYGSDSDNPQLFTGDCLFPGGVGNTRKDPVAFDSLYRGVTTKIFNRLPDQTWVYPGHGGDTTLGAERPQLAEWRARGW